MLNPNIHIICGKCGCNHMFSFEIKKEIHHEKTEKETNVVYISCDNCGTLTSLDELMEEKISIDEKNLTDDEKFMYNHNIDDEYQMDKKPDIWKFIYYPIFENGENGKKYDEPRALVESHLKNKKGEIIEGTDYREIPLRYLTKK